MSASVTSMMQTLVRISLEHVAAFVRSILASFGTASQQARDALRALVAATTVKSTKPKAFYETIETTAEVAVAIIEIDDEDATASESESESDAESDADVELNDVVLDAQVAEEDHATEHIVIVRGDGDVYDEDEGVDEDEVDNEEEDEGGDGENDEDDEDEGVHEDDQVGHQMDEDVPNDPTGPPSDEEVLIVWPAITLHDVEVGAAFDWTIQVYQSRFGGERTHGSVLLQRRLLGI